MAIISRSTTRKQLKYDLIGKDSQRGITLSYGWLANQCGHLMLGYLPTHLLYLGLKQYTSLAHPALSAGLIIAGFWFLFEVYNVVKPLAKKNGIAQVFEPDWVNIIYDTLTDLFFFWIGAMLAAMLLQFSLIALLLLLALIALVRYPARDWYITKMFQQAAEYPMQFRLSQRITPLSEENKAAVLRFLQHANSGGYHLLVCGPYKSGKTSLSIGIANECSIKHHTCKYLTAIKLFGLAHEPDAANIEVPGQLWPWRQASLLVIDDMNPGIPGQSDIVNTGIFLQFFNNHTYGVENRKLIREKNVIWVLGSSTSLPVKQMQEAWVNMLVQLGADPQRISTIGLS